MGVQVELNKVDKKKVAKALERLDVNRLMRFMIEMLDVFGNLSISLGKLEKESKETFELIRVVSSDPKSFLSKLLEKGSAEEIKTLMEALLELDSLGPKFSRLLELAPEEKISIGNKLINISNKVREAFEKSVR